MLLEKRLNIMKMSILPNIKHKLNKILIVVLAAISLLLMITPNFIWEGKKSRNLKKRRMMQICPIRNQELS